MELWDYGIIETTVLWNNADNPISDDMLQHPPKVLRANWNSGFFQMVSLKGASL